MFSDKASDLRALCVRDQGIEPCGHICVCSTCAHTVIGKKCPIPVCKRTVRSCFKSGMRGELAVASDLTRPQGQSAMCLQLRLPQNGKSPAGDAYTVQEDNRTSVSQEGMP
jgi:hypothetical protein